jgi:pyruvyl transferase EpsO
MQKDNFIKYLRKHKKETYFLVSAPGNSGDILLRNGLKFYLENNGFDITNKIKEADSILIHGGGNIDDVWYSGIELLKNIIKSYPNKKIVISPSTCHFSKTNFEQILNNHKSVVHFFAREKNSFTRLKNMNLNKNINFYLANDTAFLLEKTNYFYEIKKQSKNNYILFSFRTDRESILLNERIINLIRGFFGEFGTFGTSDIIRYKYTKYKINKFIKNIKQNYNKKKIITDASYKDYNTFIKLILNASEIYTDRMHVGILGAMLGKKVYLYKTKYDKVQGVYEQTLHSYPNVKKMF